MDREQVIATPRAHEPELRHRGIRHAALFGSVVRGEARPSSDIDLLIELDPSAPIGVFEYVELTNFIGGLFPVRLEIISEASRRLDEALRARIRNCLGAPSWAAATSTGTSMTMWPNPSSGVPSGTAFRDCLPLSSWNSSSIPTGMGPRLDRRLRVDPVVGTIGACTAPPPARGSALSPSARFRSNATAAARLG
jgi:predicted nucleotidyltransferase